MQRVLIANRGEVALRVIRACRQAGLETVSVYSQADTGAPHVWAADRAVCIGPAPAKHSYLAAGTIITVAQGSGCDAIHPGYGFLAENAQFADQCRESGLEFIGPCGATIALMGDKLSARRSAAKLGLPVVPGSDRGYTETAQAAGAAEQIGYPLLLKARSGGGGRGMRIVDSSDELDQQFVQAHREAESAFGDGSLYLERFFQRVRHIEVQIFGDRHGNYRQLGERDCSVQRRHQKLIEESPSPALDDSQRREMCQAAVALAEGIGYVNAGTVEFIHDMDSGNYYFIEMNTRIQVEHPVTETVTGTDLVAEQLRVAAGRPLSFVDHTPVSRGHAIEWRINAEDPDHGFMPAAGRISRWRPPTGRDLRLDSATYEGQAVLPYYDSLLAKLIVSGEDRDRVIARSRRALSQFDIDGIPTTVPFYQRLVDDHRFISGDIHTRWVDQHVIQGHG